MRDTIRLCDDQQQRMSELAADVRHLARESARFRAALVDIGHYLETATVKEADWIAGRINTALETTKCA